MDGAKLTEIFEKEEEVKRFVLDSRLEVLNFISKVDPEGSVDNRSVAGSESRGSTPSLALRSSVKTEKMKNPTFSGNIRLFARFKSNFQKIMVPDHPDKDHQAYIIKTSCLQGESKKLVENVDDIDKIWQRLENRYGSTTEIVNVVIKGIQQFQFSMNQDQSLVSLVDELDKGVQDLTAIGAKHELANAYTVNILQNKLPYQVLTRWLVKEREDSDDDNRSDDNASTTSSDSKDSTRTFDKMFKFLLKERKNAERMLLIKNKIEKPQPPQTPSNRRDTSGAVNGVGDTGAGFKKIINPNNKCLVHPNASHLTRKCHAF